MTFSNNNQEKADKTGVNQEKWKGKITFLCWILEKSEMLNEEMKEWQTLEQCAYNNETEGWWKRRKWKLRSEGKELRRRSAMAKRGRRNYELEKQTTTKKNTRVQRRRKIQRINVTGRENMTPVWSETEKYPTKL